MACATQAMANLKCHRPDVRYTRMNLTDDERHLLLAGLFVLTITQAADNDEEREAIRALARKLGGDPEATYFRSA